MRFRNVWAKVYPYPPLPLSPQAEKGGGPSPSPRTGRDLGRGKLLLLIVPLLVLLSAFAARFHDLDAQSLWNDEGNSLRLAQRSPADLIDAAGRDIHPPGYYLALKGWIALAGESEFSLRALSAFAGVLAVAVTIALGRALFSRASAIMAGLLVALSPLAVYYSQETRMYALLALLSALSMWAFVRWIVSLTRPHPPAPSPQSREGESTSQAPPSGLAGEGDLGGEAIRNSGVRLVLLALINAAGLYTHYSFPFTMIAQGILVVMLPWWSMRQNYPVRRLLIGYAAINLITLALFLPWLPTAWDQITSWPRTGVDLALRDQLLTVASWLTYGHTAGDVAWLRLIFPALLIAAALWLLPERRRALPRGWPVVLPLAWAGFVIGVLFVSGAYREANLKFLLPAQIALALLIGCGAWRLWRASPAARPPDRVLIAGEQTRSPRRWILRYAPRRDRLFKVAATRQMLAAVSFFLVLIGQLNALDALYRDSAYARDDYRAAAAFITRNLRPGDAIILDAPNQAEVFTYYYDGDAPVYGLPRGLGGDDTRTRREVEAVLRDHRRVFVLFWGEAERDPAHVVEAVLNESAYPVLSAWYGDVRLAQYAVLGEASTQPDELVDARFGESITLTGYALSAADVHPGDVLGVILFWTTDDPLTARYKVTVQLLAPDGQLVTQHDAEPGGNRALTTTWTPGEIVIDAHGLVIPLDLPAGQYTLAAGLYDLNPPHDRVSVVVDDEPAGDLFTWTIEIQ